MQIPMSEMTFSAIAMSVAVTLAILLLCIAEFPRLLFEKSLAGRDGQHITTFIFNVPGMPSDMGELDAMSLQ
jgi:hypothetical protein